MPDITSGFLYRFWKLPLKCLWLVFSFIVGWAMSCYRDEVLVTDALPMALARCDLPEMTELIHHTDRGSQYSADDYLALLKTYNIQVSMSGKGDPPV
jgi:transposase InsO family protein